MTLHEIIEVQEKNFNSRTNLLEEIAHSPGYHTRIPDGARVSATQTNIYYALALLELGGEQECARAAAVTRAVLKLQVTDPYDAAYGIWPWYYEEPVPEMAPPDWNWADFIGAALCHMLKEHREKIDAELVAEVTAALERAAWSIFRRNVRSAYTNIAIMGAAVTGCAGEILNNSLLSEYAASRLAAFLRYTEEQGGLNEYNSPTYTFVALRETERILQLVHSNRPLIDCAGKLREFIWGEIARRYHPATGQLGGAQSRAYAEFLPRKTVELLRETTGLPLQMTEPKREKKEAVVFSYDPLRHLPCPEKFRARFTEVSCPEQEIRQRYIKREISGISYEGTTFITPELIFGSINRECFWTQRRPMLGYWPAGEGTLPAMFRMRFLKDGRDFSSAGVRIAQAKNRAVFALLMLTDRGDWHIGLGRPADGAFSFSKLTLRFELAAEDVTLQDGNTLLSGMFKAVIHELPGRFDGGSIRWQCGRDADRGWVEAILYEGQERRVVFDDTLSTVVGGGVEILPASAAVSDEPQLVELGNSYRIQWGELYVDSPSFAVSYE